MNTAVAPRRRQKMEHPNPTDIHVGSRVRLRRTMLGMSQEKLGDALGLTFQQVQKYERGMNRIGASRLLDISRVLNVPVSFFFEEMQTVAPIAGVEPSAIPHTAAEERSRDPALKRETLELVRAYYRISSPLVRKRVADLVKAIAKSEDAE